MPALACCGVSAGPWHWPQLAASTFSAAALASAAGSPRVGAGVGPAAAPLAGVEFVWSLPGQPASNGLSSHVSRCTGATSGLALTSVARWSGPPLLLSSAALQPRPRALDRKSV